MNEIKGIVKSLASRIKAPEMYLPSYGISEDRARHHIEKQGAEFHWVVVERGEELQRRKTKDIKELMFWIFDTVTFEMACKLEVQNRIKDEDSRIQMFRIQEELIEKIDPEYRKRIEPKHRKLLRAK